MTVTACDGPAIEAMRAAGRRRAAFLALSLLALESMPIDCAAIFKSGEGAEREQHDHDAANGDRQLHGGRRGPSRTARAKAALGSPDEGGPAEGGGPGMRRGDDGG